MDAESEALSGLVALPGQFDDDVLEEPPVEGTAGEGGFAVRPSGEGEGIDSRHLADGGERPLEIVPLRIDAGVHAEPRPSGPDRPRDSPVIELFAQILSESDPELALVSTLQRDLRRADHDLNRKSAGCVHIVQLSSFLRETMVPSPEEPGSWLGVTFS
jgi:hypothetical protein